MKRLVLVLLLVSSCLLAACGAQNAEPEPVARWNSAEWDSATWNR